jgi:hypothetical protein
MGPEGRIIALTMMEMSFEMLGLPFIPAKTRIPGGIYYAAFVSNQGYS